MMDSAIQTSIRILRKTREDIQKRAEKELADIDETIRRLESSRPVEVGKQQLTVVSGQWRGMELAPALQAFLNLRGGGPVPLDEAVRALEVGEAELGKPDRHERNLKIMITNNPRTFHYDEESNTVSLIKSGRRTA